MFQKIAIVVLVGRLWYSRRATRFAGRAQDVQSAANCTENAVHGGRC